MKKKIFSILMVVATTMALVACGTGAPVSTESESVENESVETTASVEEEPKDEVVVPLAAENITIDGEFGDATGITVKSLDVKECEAFANYITDKTTAQAVYDIELFDANQNSVQPNGKVNVSITVPDEMIGAEGDNYLVYYVNADTFSQVEVVSSTTDTITFATEHFSVYAVVKFDSNVMAKEEFVKSSESNDVASEKDGEAVESENENVADVSGTDSEVVESEPVAPVFTYTDLNATKYAQQTVNVRDLPSTDGNKIGSLSTNDEIAITGQCNETGWFRFVLNGSDAYVSNKYVGDNKVEKPAASETSSNGGGNTASACPYPLWQPIDNGTSITWYCAWPDPEWETSHKATLSWIYQTLDSRNTSNIPEGMIGGTEQTESTIMGNYAEGEVRRQTYEFHLYPASLFE